MGRLTVRVVPRASRNAVAGWDAEGRLRVRLTAPPVEGEANRALVRFLASILEVSRSAVTIVSGAASRTKVVEVAGWTDAKLEQKFSKVE